MNCAKMNLMQEDRERIVSLLNGMHLFDSLNDPQITQLAKIFELMVYQPGERIITEGKLGDSFYIVLEGKVEVSHKVRDQIRKLGILVEGDYFGEEALLSHGTSVATVKAVGQTKLLRLKKIQFDNLVKKYPDVKLSLVRMVASRRYVRRHQFKWLGENEVIIQVQRKHWLFLLTGLLSPLLVCIIGFVVYFISQRVGERNISIQSFLDIAAIAFLVIGILFGLWRYIDWLNDYYLITNRRVVWLERKIFFLDSRNEAPLSTIQSVNVNRSFIGQLLGYGSVIVRTYTGQVLFHNVANPNLMAKIVEEQWQRVQRVYQMGEREELLRSVRQVFVTDETSAEEKELPPESRSSEYKEPSMWSKYFSNIFKLRIQEGIIITYRKHWLILLRKSWKPTLGILGLILASGGLQLASVIGKFNFPVLPYIYIAAVLLMILIFFPWWFYHYLDWRNDIYQVTDKNIFDIERKPFGTEIRKSAPLENILSLEHKRPGLIGYLFNIGQVNINVGDAQFDFVGVHNPASIQQDIFDRLYQFRQQKQREATAKERKRWLEMLTEYHRMAKDYNSQSTSSNGTQSIPKNE